MKDWEKTRGRKGKSFELVETVLTAALSPWVTCWSVVMSWDEGRREKGATWPVTETIMAGGELGEVADPAASWSQ